MKLLSKMINLISLLYKNSDKQCKLQKYICQIFQILPIIILSMYKQNLREEHSKRIKALKKFLFEYESPASKTLSNHQQTSDQHGENCKKLLNQGNCARCNQLPIKIKCPICKVSFCYLCDKLIHNFAKFTTHQRITLQFPSQENINNHSSMEIRSILGIQKEEPNQHIEDIIQNLNATQKWNKIIYEVQFKFQEFFNLLNEKKEDILIKLQKKRDDQIRLHFENSKEAKSRKKSDSEAGQKIEYYQSARMKTTAQCEREDDCGKCLGKIQVNGTYFQQIKSSLEKIQIRNIISKKVCHHEQEYKKKMKTSLLTNMQSTNIPSYTAGIKSPKNTFDLSSPLNLGFRSPKNNKCSQSFVIQKKNNNTSIKLNEQELDLSRSKKNDSSKLIKVKSQKFIMKPKNIDLSTRSPVNKTKKLEIMI